MSWRVLITSYQKRISPGVEKSGWERGKSFRTRIFICLLQKISIQRLVISKPVEDEHDDTDDEADDDEDYIGVDNVLVSPQSNTEPCEAQTQRVDCPEEELCWRHHLAIVSAAHQQADAETIGGHLDPWSNEVSEEHLPSGVGLDQGSSELQAGQAQGQGGEDQLGDVGSSPGHTPHLYSTV